MQKLGISLRPTKQILTAFDGSSLDVVGEVFVRIVCGKIHRDHRDQLKNLPLRLVKGGDSSIDKCWGGDSSIAHIQ